MKSLTIPGLKVAARKFLVRLTATPLPKLYGVTDGKAVGSFVEHEFHEYLGTNFAYIRGSSASGIDFPGLQIDLKVTSVRQPQSSCPFRSASQKVYGLGYHLMVFVYDKIDNHEGRSAQLAFQHGLFVEKKRTADFQTTRGLMDILERDGNVDDVIAFLEERNLPLDEIGRRDLAEQIVAQPPTLGVLTISNALQWRLQYGRAIALSGNEPGVENLL